MGKKPRRLVAQPVGCKGVILGTVRRVEEFARTETLSFKVTLLVAVALHVQDGCDSGGQAVRSAAKPRARK